jgi:hypothetical protein
MPHPIIPEKQPAAVRAAIICQTLRERPKEVPLMVMPIIQTSMTGLRPILCESPVQKYRRKMHSAAEKAPSTIPSSRRASTKPFEADVSKGTASISLTSVKSEMFFGNSYTFKHFTDIGEYAEVVL